MSWANSTSLWLRAFDLIGAGVGLLLGAPLLVIIAIIGALETGSPFFRQVRVGRDQKPFTLIKFRSMVRTAPERATHLVSSDQVTAFGSFLRRSKLDELPQLWNVLLGDMSLVGPRPCLPSQTELLGARESLGVFRVRPGVTGLGQLSGVDMSQPLLLAKLDAEMIEGLTVRAYLHYVVLTALGRGSGDRVSK